MDDSFHYLSMINHMTVQKKLIDIHHEYSYNSKCLNYNYYI